MLTLLMQTNRKYSVDDLAEILEVDRRTVYRYITTFNHAGFVIQTNHRHVRLAQNTLLHKQLSDLLYFNQEEAMTLYNAIDAIESTETVGNGNTFHTLSGMQIQGIPTQKGVYIVNGKKVLVK